jgi:hypothetical protein
MFVNQVGDFIAGRGPFRLGVPMRFPRESHETLQKVAAPEEIRTPGPQIRSLVFARPARLRNPPALVDRRFTLRETSNKIIQKELAFVVKTSGSVAVLDEADRLVSGSCPAGLLANAGLRW